MPVPSIKQLLAQIGAVTPDQFTAMMKAWRVAQENGSQEPLLAFFGRECGMTEEKFLQEMANALGWQYIDLKNRDIPVEARNRISQIAQRLGLNRPHTPGASLPGTVTAGSSRFLQEV